MPGMQPPAYQPTTDFSDEERDNVGGRSTLRTAALDTELTNIAATLSAVRANLSLNQRDDGEIRDGRVKLFTLSQDVLNLLVAQGDATPRGPWVTATAYDIKDIVTFGGSTYLAGVAHVSGGSFATDLAASKWILIAAQIPGASGVSFTPTATLAATNVQAAIDEADTENRALSAAVTAGLAAFIAALADATDTAKGDALIAVKMALTDAVARTQHDVNRDFVFVENFRLPGDADDTLSIQRALNQGLTANLRPNKTYTAFGLTAVAGTGIVCPSGRARIVVPAGASRWGVKIEANDFTVSGINWDGGDTTDYKIGSDSPGTRSAVIVGAVYGSGVNLSGITVHNCDFTGFDSDGLLGREVEFGSTDFDKRVSLHNLRAYRCFNGIYASQRFEYVHMTDIVAFDCRNAVRLQAGNNSLSCVRGNYSYRNWYFETGYNDGHGQLAACSSNHSFGGYAVYAKDIANGFMISGLAIWFGTLRLDNCAGINITGCQLNSVDIQVVGGGCNYIDGNQFIGGITRSYSGNVFSSFNRNKYSNSPLSTDLTPWLGDLWMASKTSTSIGAVFINLVPAEMNITYTTKKWMGEDLAALQVGQRAVIQRTGKVRTYVTVTVTVGGNNQLITLSLIRYDATGVTQNEVLPLGTYAVATLTGLSIHRVVEWDFTVGEMISIQLHTSVATGFTLTAVDVRHELVY